MIRRFVREERGATAIEYGLIAALVAVAALAGMQLTGGSVDDLYANNQDQIGGAISSAGD